MQYIYAAMLLHAAGKPITEDGVKNVLAGAGVKAEDARIKSLVASLEGKNVNDIIASASAFVPAGSAAAPAAGGKPAAQGKPEGKKEEKKKEEPKKTEEDAAAGLGALFG
jgi:large subunit ribosomal protein L12